MVKIIGLTGLRPTRKAISKITSPPYDVIKQGSSLEYFLKKNKDSVYHVILGRDPVSAFQRLIGKAWLKEDHQPCFYIYEQEYNNSIRSGVFVVAEVSDGVLTLRVPKTKEAKGKRVKVKVKK